MPRDFDLSCGGWLLRGTPAGLPDEYDALRAHAAVALERGLGGRDLCFFSARRDGEEWPRLTLAVGCPRERTGFAPLLLLSEGTLFFAYGERALVCALERPALLGEEPAPGGARFWEQHGEVVLLGAEGALVAWTSAGEKLWTLPVAPPWQHRVEGTRLELSDAKGRSGFALREGPRA